MGLNFDHITERIEQPRTDLPAHSYEYYVNLTAKLIAPTLVAQGTPKGRVYIATAKIVEKWPLEKIIRRYEQATKHCPEKSTPEVHWWALRKREIDND